MMGMGSHYVKGKGKGYDYVDDDTYYGKVSVDL